MFTHANKLKTETYTYAYNNESWDVGKRVKEMTQKQSEASRVDFNVEFSSLLFLLGTRLLQVYNKRPPTNKSPPITKSIAEGHNFPILVTSSTLN